MIFKIRQTRGMVVVVSPDGVETMALFDAKQQIYFYSFRFDAPDQRVLYNMVMAQVSRGSRA